MEVDLQKRSRIATFGALDQVMSCDRSLVEERILDLKYDNSPRPDYLKYFLFGSSTPLLLVTNHYQAFQWMVCTGSPGQQKSRITSRLHLIGPNGVLLTHTNP